MRSNKRKSPPPLNFTPEDAPKARGLAEDRQRVGFGPTPKPAKLRRAPPTAPEDMPLGLSPSMQQPPRPSGGARYTYVVAWVAALAWAGVLLAYTAGYLGGLGGLLRAPLQLAVVCLMAVLPAVFIFAGAYAVRQGARLAAEARWTRTMAEDFVTPAALAAARTGDIATTVRAEVERASAAAIAAHGQLIAVREALSDETDRLGEAAAQAQHTARAVSETLTREREAVAGLFAELRSHSDGLAAGVERQSRLVGEASDLARSQLQEAEATLASGAERLASASTDAGAAARRAGEDLSRQAERLDVAAAALSERLRFLDARLSEQRGALSGLLQTLDTEQDDLAARLETHRAQMLDVIAEARTGASELGAAAFDGGEALRALIEAGLAQTRDVAAAVRAEQAALRIEATESRAEAQGELHRTLDALARTGEDARLALASAGEQAQTAAAGRVAAARAEVEQIGEMAFAAGQQADQAFQARLGDARRVIEQTTALVEDAGLRAGERIEAGLGASRGALGELTSTLGEMDARLARIPAVAREHAEATRLAVERSLGEMNASARRASEETQSLDAAFQDRIRRSYEALSEAVRLMGRVTGAADVKRDVAPPQRTEAVAPTAPAKPPAADPFAAIRRPFEPPPSPSLRTDPPRSELLAPERRPGAAGRAAASTPVFGRATAREMEPTSPEMLLEAGTDPQRRTSEPALTRLDPPDLRPRLKFTPTEADQALKAVFARPEPEAATGARPPAGRGEWDVDLDEWTWKDLLTSMDDTPTDTDALSDQMIREIETLGVDAAALLPRARVEDIASALIAGEASAGRDAVRRLAPAAIRRLSRRVLTDRPLREQVDRYVGRYQSLLREAAGRDDRAIGASALLASDAGRAYLLLDAAVGEL